MKAFILSALLLAASSLSVSATSLRGWHDQAVPSNSTSNAMVDVPSAQRKLAAGTFSPLICNSGLDTATCSNWTDTFTTSTNHQDLIVVPCGQVSDRINQGLFLCAKRHILSFSLSFSVLFVQVLHNGLGSAGPYSCWRP